MLSPVVIDTAWNLDRASANPPPHRIEIVAEIRDQHLWARILDHAPDTDGAATLARLLEACLRELTEAGIASQSAGSGLSRSELDDLLDNLDD